ncbi:MAG: 4Fe-4S dicluster domain-containing protein [Fusobacteriaceae bacterium]
MKRIKIVREKCIGCLTCVSACIVSHNDEPRNRVVTDSSMKFSPIFCRNCDLPECVYTCMSGAMTKNISTGTVDYDEEKCASCYMCIMSCPYGVLKPDSRTKKRILKCDSCEHIENGPQCVAKCPMSAITFEEVN